MKKMDDEELQNWIDENRQSIQKSNDLISNDAKAYRILFDALDTEPTQGLSYDFAAKVTRKVQVETKRNSELKFYLMALGGFIAFIAAIYGVVMLLKPGVKNEYVDLLLQYKWALILVIFSFLTIQYLDQVLVKANIFRKQQHK